MTEAEWLVAWGPQFILDPSIDSASDRKLRLFCCALCRRNWDLLPISGQEAVRIAEEFADGSVTETERWKIFHEIAETSGGSAERNVGWNMVALTQLNSIAMLAALTLATNDDFLMEMHTGRAICHREPDKRGMPIRARECCSHAALIPAIQDEQRRAMGRRAIGRAWKAVKDFAAGRHSWNLDLNGEIIQHREWAHQATLFREIVGNPFRPVDFDSEWRTSTVLAMAKEMYESRDFSAMPIFADALQDTGCEHDDILSHCRDENATHVRGCWVVDLVLGKE